MANQIPAIPRNIPSDSDITSAVALKHSRQHTVTTTSDHTSSATSGKVLKADANGLPVDATNTDTDVADAVTKKHSQNSSNSFSEPSGAVATHAALTTGIHGAGTGEVVAKTVVDFIHRQLYLKDEPLIIDSGTVIVVGSDNKASIWCDANRWWDRWSAGFQALVELNRENVFVLNTNEVLDIPADSPVERHIDRATIDTGALWIK